MTYKGKTTPADLQRLVDKYKRDKSNAEFEVGQLRKENEDLQSKFDTLNHAMHNLAHNDQLDIGITARYIASKALEETT